VSLVHWYKKRFEGVPLAKDAIQNAFKQLLISKAEPVGMLLIEEVHTPTGSTLWVRLPAPRHPSAFTGFIPADETALPKTPKFLLGSRAAFDKQFD